MNNQSEETHQQNNFEALAPFQKFLTIVVWIMAIAMLAYAVYHSMPDYFEAILQVKK